MYYRNVHTSLIVATNVQQCELYVLHACCVTVLSVCCRTHAKLDMGKFANCKGLRELRLRGMCGLIMPAFSFSGGLPELAVLTNIKILVRLPTPSCAHL